MTLDVRAMPGRIGAEIRGIDLSQPVDANLRAQLLRAWYDHVVLLIRAQTLTDTELVAVSRIFGEPEQAPPNKSGVNWVDGFPELTCISNIEIGGMAIGSLGAGEAIWHTDMSYIDTPPTASLLYALEVPPAGGDTYFMNMYAAYETLPADLKQQIEGKFAVHDATYTSAGEVRKKYAAFDGNTDPDRAPGARHPLVVRHPETGRRALFLGRRSGASGILGEPDSSLFDALWEHCRRCEAVYRHRWQVGDVLIWDNRCCMHYREAFNPASRRLMHRAQIKGSRPVPAWDTAA